jgi:hypothetical protein
MNSLSELNTFSATGVPYYNAATSSTVTSAYRYAFNGVVSTDKTVMQNLESMATACGSWISYDSHDGKWSVVINKSDTSVASFTDANIIGPITVSGTDINELYNQVKCQFPHVDLKDNLDYVNVEIPIGSRNINEPINSLDMQFDILNDPVQAQLLGTINLKQSRIDKIIRFTSDFSKLGLKAGNVIDITSDIYGFTAKKFRITSLIEKDADDGSIQLDITALEYDENVYSTADLYRYVVSNSTGIIGIGSIGKPGLPEVVKTEVASLPKITVTSTSPTGIVEAMEFWYTRDVPPGNNVDSTRSYTLLGTVKPTNGTTFTYGTAVSLDVSTLGTGNFLIKSRGINTTTAGQYSDPSGVVYYAPKQITDGIGQDTAVYDATGALISTLAVNYLLNNLDQLFKGNVSIGSIFDQVFGLFNDQTGVDLVTQANAGTTLLGITHNGYTITPTAANIEFTGTGVKTVTSINNDVIVDIGYTAGGGLEIIDNVINVTTGANIVPGTGISIVGNVISTDLVPGTGISIVGNTISSQTLGIKYNETIVTDGATEINFTGNGISSITQTGNSVTITIPGTTNGNISIINDLNDVNTLSIAPVLYDYLMWDGSNWVPDQSGVTRSATRPSDSGICDIDGFFAAGRAIITPKPASSYLTSCNEHEPWTVKPNTTGYTLANTPPTKTFNGSFWLVTYTLNSAYTLPTTQQWYRVYGVTPSSYNGKFQMHSSTSTTIVLRYPVDPGPYASGILSASVVSTNLVGIPTSGSLKKKMVIKNDSSISGEYSLSISCSAGYVSIGTDFSSDGKWVPTSISGTSGLFGYSYVSPIGISSTPLTIVGSYDCINQILQSGINWTYAEGTNIYSIPIPPTYTSPTITYTLTVDGVTKNHVEVLEYVDYFLLNPFKDF